MRAHCLPLKSLQPAAEGQAGTQETEESNSGLSCGRQGGRAISLSLPAPHNIWGGPEPGPSLKQQGLTPFLRNHSGRPLPGSEAAAPRILHRGAREAQRKQNGSADRPSSTGDEYLEPHPGRAMLWDLEALHSY